MPEFCVIAKEQCDCGNPPNVRADFLGFPLWGNAGTTFQVVTDEGIFTLLIVQRAIVAQGKPCFLSPRDVGRCPTTHQRNTFLWKPQNG
jgi:hypothetical protein